MYNGKYYKWLENVTIQQQNMATDISCQPYFYLFNTALNQKVFNTSANFNFSKLKMFTTETESSKILIYNNNFKLTYNAKINCPKSNSCVVWLLA